MPLTHEITQTAARDFLKPAGFGLVETIKQPNQAEPALRRVLKAPNAATAVAYYLGLVRVAMTTEGQKYWVQLWQKEKEVRLTIIDPRTLCLARVYELCPNCEVLFPPKGYTSQDLVKGAGF